MLKVFNSLKVGVEEIRNMYGIQPVGDGASLLEYANVLAYFFNQHDEDSKASITLSPNSLYFRSYTGNVELTIYHRRHWITKQRTDFVFQFNWNTEREDAREGDWKSTFLSMGWVETQPTTPDYATYSN